MQAFNTNPYHYRTSKDTTHELFACIYADDGTWCQTDRRAIERCLQGANDFCDFTGQEISAAKSHALAIEWAASRRYAKPAEPLNLNLWRSSGNAKNPDINESLSEIQYPQNIQYTNWALYHESTEHVEWKSIKEHIRHLGNTQSADGGHSLMLSNMLTEMPRRLQNQCLGPRHWGSSVWPLPQTGDPVWGPPVCGLPVCGYPVQCLGSKHCRSSV